MQTLRRLYACNPRDAFSRLSLRRLLALCLVVIVPGGLVVPLCYGLYGALRHSLSGKANRGDSALTAVIPETSQR
jgi:hypothetical protein